MGVYPLNIFSHCVIGISNTSFRLVSVPDLSDTFCNDFKCVRLLVHGYDCEYEFAFFLRWYKYLIKNIIMNTLHCALLNLT